MKKILFVLFSSIFLFTQIIPVTSVHATEVTWGDSNVVNLDSKTLELSRKIVGLNLLQELVSNGVTEFTINNVTSLDDFIDDLLDEIKTSAEQGINPEGLINVNLWNDLNNLNNHIDDSIKKVGNYLIENDYPMPSGTGLTFQNYMDVEQGQWWTNHKSKLISSPITPFGLRSLSRLSNNEIEINPDPNYSSLISQISIWKFIHVPNNSIVVPDVWTANTYGDYSGRYFQWYGYRQDVTYLKPQGGTPESWDTVGYTHFPVYSLDRIVNFNIITISDNNYEITGTFGYSNRFYQQNSGIYVNTWYPDYNGPLISAYRYGEVSSPSYQLPLQNFNTLYNAIYYLVSTFKNFNLYVDGVPWVLVNTPTNMSLDINGMKFYTDTDIPTQYQYPDDTYIDYNKLYQIILRAIQNGTPVSNETLVEGDTYYDSHDYVYSPTTYNYYGDDSEDEDSVISELLNIAIIPKFNTSFLNSIEEPLDTGTEIISTTADVIPRDILIVFGGLFVLSLFVLMINRMIK